MSKIIKDKYFEVVDDILNSKDIRGKVAVDATAGKGEDTVKLSRAVGELGKVYSFDIQKEAIEITSNKLADLEIDNVILVNSSHEDIDLFVAETIDFAIFNLGYLPGFNKSIVTRASSTSMAVKKVSEKLGVGGIIILTLYTGHCGAAEELLALENTLKELPQKQFAVQKIQFINQINKPPQLYLVERLKS